MNKQGIDQLLQDWLTESTKDFKLWTGAKIYENPMYKGLTEKERIELKTKLIKEHNHE